ncbi:type I polyketide synthase [Stigmatella aurantiaca]|uniref:Polyketide synthase AufD n=3 Tax=Stigmatella aurantiaca TaxID=41 RepID=A8YP85_STIAU|nr:type I polyketide synthase [Stigmatella aurantiaca]ADO72988.1 modular polyketide synthase [Stigmatella aurantiaca DW4/3-1]CAO98879.1 polyketide synthase AufD [Stigmatella aurantiaca DW4/3-1]
MTASTQDGSQQQRALLERATVTIKKLRAENAQLRSAQKEPIAIIGMACRFPGGANDPESYWRLLAGGVDAIREIPPERWPAGEIDVNELPALRWAGLIDSVDGFDAGFFGITPREAAHLDPQQRLLLEVSCEALENALQPADRLIQHPVGVFVGIASSDYQHHVLALPPEEQNGYSATGNMPSVAAGRIAYTLGLQGPCAAVDTACSSSLVALHMACQSLRSGESTLALAGGVNLLLSSTWMRMVGLTQSLSPDGRCRTFDARANGFVRGEGCGVVVLKRLSDAQRDGDHVWAVLRGSSINHDGRSGGLTVPNVLSQEATLRKALDSAEVAASDIGYVEAHGTGTPLGDPIELDALKSVLGQERGGERHCVVGSVKTNIGHLEAAAGIAGLIKVVLSLGKETLPAHLHFRGLNPRVSLDQSSLVIGAEARPWPAGDVPRRAVVSSFGISGTNACVVVEEAPARPTDEAAPQPPIGASLPGEFLLPLSARSPEALRALALAHARWLGEPGNTGSLEQHIHLTSTRRSHHSIRQGFVGGTRAELVESLKAFAGQADLPVAETIKAPRIAMIFPGQGSQWLGMGRELHAREPVFRDALTAFDAAMRKVAGWSVLEELFAEAERARLDQVDVIQPCIVAIQLSLAALWRSWGVEPSAVIGQSMGEVSAAYVAGALSIEDTARVITARSRLVKQLRGGAMASVGLPASELEGVLGEGLGVAAINGPASTLVAGRSDAIDRLVTEMAGRGVFCRKVKVDYASHSPEVEPLRMPLLEALSSVRGLPPALAFRSTVHRSWVGAGDLGPEYWYQNLREPVQLFPVLEALLAEDGIDVLLEVSPHPILGPVLQAASTHVGRDAAVFASLRREQAEQKTLLLTLAALYARGQAVAFERVGVKALSDRATRWSPLPTYPWQRQRHWLPAVERLRTVERATEGSRDCLPPGHRLRSPALRDAVYEVVLRSTSLRCFESHRVEGGVIAPASWILSMVVAALRDLGFRGPVASRQMTFARPLAIPDGEERHVQLILSPEAGRPTRFQLLSAAGNGPAEERSWTLLSEGTIVLGEALPLERLDVASLSGRMEAVPSASIGVMAGAPGPEGWIEALHRGGQEVLCRLRTPRASDHAERFVLHPEPLNEALTALVACSGLAGHRYAPIAIDALELIGQADVAWIHGTVEQVESGGRSALSVALHLYDEAYRPVAVVSRMHCVPAFLEGSIKAETGLLARGRYEVAWQLLEPVSATTAPATVPAAEPGRWLIFPDARGACELLAARLEAEGHDCVRFSGGLEPGAELREQLTAAAAGGRPLRGILFGCGLDAVAEPGQPFSSGQLEAVRALLQLAGAIAARSLGPVWILTRGAVSIEEGETIDAPAAAALWGMGRVLGREHPEAVPRLVDVDPRGPVTANAEQLHRALSMGSSPEHQLALRADRIFGLRLRRGRDDHARQSLTPSPEASYLITGGLGRLGLSVAEWLVARGARNLVLLARSLPSEEAARRILALEQQGARILVARADVANFAALGQALAAAEAELPAIRGVIHAAGQARQALLADESWQDYTEVLGAKAAGAWNLHQLTKDRTLDFFVMFSSIAGILGFGGMGSYAAANTYLDALAVHRRGLGLPALSVAWGLWDQDLDQQLGERAMRVGLEPFAAADGLQALGVLAAGQATHAIVASMDWARHLQDRAGAVPPWLHGLAVSPSGPASPREPEGASKFLGSLAGLSAQAAAERISAHVGGVVAETLGYPRYHALPRSKGFFDIGFDSLLAMDLRRRLVKDFAHPFPVTLAFDHPTIERLTSFLVSYWHENGAAARSGTGAVALLPAPSSTTVADPLATAVQVRSDSAVEPIAIVGIGCRFPGGVVDPETFWNLLIQGRDATSEAPHGRWDDESLFDPDPSAPGKFNVRRAGFLSDIESFDPEFFGISPREAARMDPQQRLLLEVTWEALEHAGQPADALVDSATGVFVSGAPNQYLSRFGEDPSELDAYALTGNLPCTLSGRVSYVLGLRGPNLFLDTGCSGALVALHLACQSLRAGECNLALAGGVNVLLSAEMMIGLGKTGTLAPDGRCKTFDASANGFGRGEGCGVLVVKRLSDAQAHGDRIIAVVRGSSVNHDGRSSGLTVPSGPAQQLLMERALQQARISAAQVGFVEAHGTGTQLGDPIEVGALAAVYGRASGRTSPCFLGAVKSNLGHLEAAAGVAGVIKAALAVERGEIPPNVHFAEINPKLPMEGEPFDIPTRLHAWPSTGRRLAAVSSFGLGGTNAHTVLEAAPSIVSSIESAARDVAPGRDRPAHVVTLSARDREALVEQARRLSAFVAQRPSLRLADVAFSANSGRTHLPHRLAIVFSSLEELRARLDAFAEAPSGSDAAHGVVTDAPRPRIGFLFTGQGSQYVGMAKELYETQPVFRDAIEECAAFLDRTAEQPLLTLLADGHSIDRTGRAQPALFAVQYALTRLWRSWGIEPHAVFGHSVGEVAAACAAGVLSLEDALLLIQERARWMETIPDGGVMVSVRAAAGEVEEALAPHAGVVAIAALNGPEHTVISGDRDAVLAIAADFRARGIETKQLRVSVAFHSPAVEPILAPFMRSISSISARPAQLPWVTGLTGTTLPHLEADYWSRQIREPVQFTAAMTALAGLGCDVLLEIGPHPTLTGLAAETLPGSILCLPSLRRGHADTEVIAHSLARLHVAGAPIDLRAWDQPFSRQRHPLPSYPFQRRRLWFDAPSRRRLPSSAGAGAAEREASWYSRCEWREAAPSRLAPSSPRAGHWIVLADAGGFAAALAEVLAARGDTCSLLRPDGLEHQDPAASSHGSGHRWTVPGMARALDAARSAGRPLRGIVHLWSLDVAPTQAIDDDALDRAESLNLGSVLALVQALAARGSSATGDGARLWMVTRGAVCTGNDGASVSVAQAPAWGLGAVIANEHPEIWGGAVDLDAGEGAQRPVREQAAELVGELTGESGEDRVAWRGGRRLIARLARRLPTRTSPVSIRRDATYLVTGGHGALGLAVAGWLAQRGAKHLTLVSRRGPSEGAQAAIAGLTAEGVVVNSVLADIGVPGDVRALLQRIEESGPPLRGVIHAAGIVEDGLIVNQSWEAFERVLRPKVRGAWHLHRNARDLDFFVHFSSASSLLGPHGQASYAAANAFLDALAYHQRAHHTPAVTINWGPWEAGMAARLDAETSRRTLGTGWTPLSISDGWSALDRIVASDEAQVAVLPAIWSVLDGDGRRAPLTRELAGTGGESLPARAQAAEVRVRDTLLAVAPTERKRVLEDHVRQVVERTLGWGARAGDELGPKRRFVEVGMDSLMAIEIRNRLQRELDLTLAATTLFNYPTISALTDHLATMLASAGIVPADAPAATSPTPVLGTQPVRAVEPSEDEGGELSDAELAELIAKKYDSRL